MPYDRLTELQNQLTHLSHMFYTCVGVIQRDAPPVSLETQEITETQKEYNEMIQDMAVQVVSTVKKIDALIESLPAMDTTEEEQMEALVDLDKKNKEVGMKLEEKVEAAELMLKQVREALKVITEDRFNEEEKKRD